MTAPAPTRSPRLKSLTAPADRLSYAGPAPAPAAGRAPKVAAEGAHSSVRSGPRPVTVAGVLPGLQVRLTRVPVADWLCRCGRHQRATGKAAVIALTTLARAGDCPHTPAPATEGSKAA
jgi:hypothetical protein